MELFSSIVLDAAFARRAAASFASAATARCFARLSSVLSKTAFSVALPRQAAAVCAAASAEANCFRESLLTPPHVAGASVVPAAAALDNDSAPLPGASVPAATDA